LVRSDELLSAFLEFGSDAAVIRLPLAGAAIISNPSASSHILSRVAFPVFFKALGVCPITKSECSPIAGDFSCIYGKRFLRGFVLRKGFLQTKKERQRWLMKILGA